ncbi:hypothetical protein [Spirosoma sp. 209]|nr:hypothetical protein [Spirosoma sp. 209]
MKARRILLATVPFAGLVAAQYINHLLKQPSRRLTDVDQTNLTNPSLP